MINSQRSCESWIFSLFLVNFFPIFPFNCQFQDFLHNFMQNSEKFSTLRAICSYTQFCVRIGKILKDAMKIFTGVGKKKQGRNWHVFV